MFKTKLQELCHQKRWALPRYSCMKDGEDHNPQFKASVVVNGINFETPSIGKSLKESQNEVAKLAFLHFTSYNKAICEGSKAEQTQKASLITSNTSSVEADDKATCGGSKTDQAQKVSDMNSTASSFEEEVQQKYKMKLKIYAERKKLGLTLYHIKSTVQSDALCFKALVTVGGVSFASPGFYETIKYAEDAAAQVALMSFVTDSFHEDNLSLYKNELQELAMERGCFMPEHKTVKFVDACGPMFISTVEVEGEIFHGYPANSKKQAELSAARIAYSSLMQRKSCCKDDYSSSSLKDETLELAPVLDSLTFHDQPIDPKPGSSSISTSCIKFAPQTEGSKDEGQEIALTGNISRRAKISNKEVIASPVLSGTDSSSKTRADDKTYLLCNRIKVYTFIPDVTFTKGNVALPIADGKWAVVNLEFPREKDT